MTYPQPCSTYTRNNFLFDCILIFQGFNTLFSSKIDYLSFSYTFFKSHVTWMLAFNTVMLHGSFRDGLQYLVNFLGKVLQGHTSAIVYRSLHYILLLTLETKSGCRRREDSGCDRQGTGPWWASVMSKYKEPNILSLVKSCSSLIHLDQSHSTIFQPRKESFSGLY